MGEHHGRKLARGVGQVDGRGTGSGADWPQLWPVLVDELDDVGAGREPAEPLLEAPRPALQGERRGVVVETLIGR